MKCAVVLLVLSTTCAITNGLRCMFNENACARDECCVKIGLITRCKPRLNEGSICAKRPMTHLFRKHVYRLACPCNEGLKCAGNARIIGKVVGRCTAVGTGDEDEDYEDEYDNGGDGNDNGGDEYDDGEDEYDNGGDEPVIDDGAENAIEDGNEDAIDNGDKHVIDDGEENATTE